MQVSWSPMARCTSVAATAESTPPDSAQMTCPSPTRSRISATLLSMKFGGVQVWRAPAISTTKLRSTSRPIGVCTTSGWNWMPYRLRDGSARPAYGVESVWAVARKPSGGRRIESPWLIQTGCSRSMPANNPVASVRLTVAGPYSRLADGTTSPPSSWAMSWSP